MLVAVGFAEHQGRSDPQPILTRRLHDIDTGQYIPRAVRRLKQINMAAWPDKRNGLFRKLAADYQTFRPEAVDIVACPLCLTEYGTAIISDLSREHIVPPNSGDARKR